MLFGSHKVGISVERKERNGKHKEATKLAVNIFVWYYLFGQKNVQAKALVYMKRTK